jgi:hypothetical protein
MDDNSVLTASSHLGTAFDSGSVRKEEENKGRGKQEKEGERLALGRYVLMAVAHES